MRKNTYSVTIKLKKYKDVFDIKDNIPNTSLTFSVKAENYSKAGRKIYKTLEAMNLPVKHLHKGGSFYFDDTWVQVKEDKKKNATKALSMLKEDLKTLNMVPSC